MGPLRANMAALSERPFRLLWLGQALSAVGDSMVYVALAFAVLRLTGSATDLGLVAAANTLPRALLTLVAGVWADRLPRNLVMRAADLARVGTQGFVAADLLSGRAQVWHLAAAAACYGAASAFFQPAMSGLVPQTVSSEHLQQANALVQLTRSGLSIAGPGVSGALVAAVGAGWVYAVDSASFLGSAICLTLITVPAAIPAAARRRFLVELSEGWRIVRERTWLWANLIGFATANFAVASYLVLGPLVVFRQLGGAASWGVLSACWSGGAVAGGVAALRLRPRRPLVACAGLWTLNGIQSILFAGPPPLSVLACTAFAGGFGLALGNTLWETVLQRQVPREALSRVSSFDWMISLVTMPLGYVLVGPVSDRVGVRTTLLALGAGFVLLNATLAALPAIRRIGLEPAPEQAPAPAL